MSEIIKFDTEEVIKGGSTLTSEKPKLFPLLPENHPILKQVMPEFDFKNPPVNPNEFASSLVETCKHHRGYGLSANQCGFSYRVFVMGTGDDFVAFFNPEIINVSKETVHLAEGCLSFPLLGLHITRPAEIGVRYQDFNGEWKGATFSGISARCFQHELDHMNGVVYTDRVKPLALQQGMKKRNKILKQIGLRK
jgi:peptide deformylase